MLARVDLVELIGHYISLIPAGREFKGRCPFHEEKAPSFHVNPEKGLYHCFGCKAGGNAIDFVMAIENLEFRDALEWLARRYNIDIARYASAGRPAGQKERLYQLNEAAAKFFRQCLKGTGGEYVRRYLAKRDVPERLIAEFDLGYAPREWHALADTLTEHGARATELASLGLIKPRRGEGPMPEGGESSGYYDAFRHRLVFPIRNAVGRVIAFAGRALSEEDSPKYLNVTNTPLYDKSKVLYNLDRAKGQMKEAGAVIVEGYMDVIGLARAGVLNAIATCGTAFTAGHVKLLSRYTDRFFIAFDGDEAGQRAAWSAGVLFLRSGYDARIVALPAGVDPDSLVQEKGQAAWNALLSDAAGVVRFWLDHQRQTQPQAGLTEQRRWITQLAPLYRQVPDELVRQQLVQEVAGALRMGAAEAAALLSSTRLRAGDFTGGAGITPRDGGATKQQLAQQVRERALMQGALPIEREVLRRLFTDEEFRFVYHELAEPAWFAIPQHQALYEEMIAADEPDRLIHDDRFKELLTELLNTEPLQDDNDGLLARHNIMYLEREATAASAQLREADAAGDTDKLRMLTEQIQQLKAQMRDLQRRRGS